MVFHFQFLIFNFSLISQGCQGIIGSVPPPFWINSNRVLARFMNAFVSLKNFYKDKSFQPIKKI